MYKSFKRKNLRVAINRFRRTAKDVSKVYWSGVRNWESDDSMNYSLVLGTYRVILSIEKSHFGTCPG